MSSHLALPEDLEVRALVPLAGVMGLNIAVWLCVLGFSKEQSALLGTSLIAYLLGIRHGFDADHISAIDNIVRRFVSAGKPAVSVGFWFALGHSSIVIAATALVAWSATQFTERVEFLKDFGSIWGTAISAVVLFMVALLNIPVFQANWRRLAARNGGHAETRASGLITRLGRSLFGMVSKRQHIYFIGLLFGLGFDTASEVALLTMSAASSAKGLPFASILLLPILFTAGMALIDTGDSVMMTKAYGWASTNSSSLLRYNLFVTGLSIAVALAVGGIELLNVFASVWAPTGTVWNVATNLGDHFAPLGVAIAAVFLFSWALAYLRQKHQASRSITDHETDVSGRV